MLVGNKTDLSEKRQVSTDEGERKVIVVRSCRSPEYRVKIFFFNFLCATSSGATEQGDNFGAISNEHRLSEPRVYLD